MKELKESTMYLVWQGRPNRSLMKSRKKKEAVSSRFDGFDLKLDKIMDKMSNLLGSTQQ